MVVVPAPVTHSLTNAGDTLLRVVGFFSSAAAVHTYEEPMMPFETDVLITPPPETLRAPYE